MRLTNQQIQFISHVAHQVALLETDVELAERVEAFVGRFGRLQDNLGDKLLPLLLLALGEKATSAIDNFDLAERLGFLKSLIPAQTKKLLNLSPLVPQLLEQKDVLTLMWILVAINLTGTMPMPGKIFIDTLRCPPLYRSLT